ncbi:cell division control protein 48 C-like protein [Carex littledalei]|uniref:Cell division control protein 48 C-like protein n=1 Tax=Carex littledalei TaxID=544730 RepID=A0A833VLN1_9POAL|nr:cell division control protein 48 C-like protein [Carex littledalei]
MGKRMRRGGGRSPSTGLSSESRLLRKRIVESKLEASLDAESVALSLRNRHPAYRRLKLQPFSHQVSQVLASLRHPSTTADTSHDDASDSDNSASPTTSHKRRSRRPSLSLSESRLLQLESNHCHRHFRLDISDEESDGSQSTSTSEGDDPDPELDFDVTKSILRNSYLKKSTPKQPVKRVQDRPWPQVSDESASAKSPVKNRQENNMEIDVATEKPKVVETNNGPVSEGVVAVGYNGNSGGQEGKVGPKFADLGGMKGVIEELMMEVIVPLCHPQLPRFLGVKPMAGLLLHGPPGCGKTTLAHAIANETGVPFYKISAPEVVSGVSGASEENIRSLFKKAFRTAPSIVFIDEIDAIASKRENLQREMERRIVTQLMTCMDQFHQAVDQEPDLSQDKPPGYVLVIGATNRPDAVDQALRRPGRFDREIALSIPDEAARAEILSMLTKRLRLEGKFDLFKIARSTPGFVGADLKSLVDKAGNLAMKRIIDKRKISLNLEDWWRRPWDEAEMESLSITMADFEDATKIVQPSLRREGFSSIPNVTWNDVGGLSLIRKVFERYIVRRIKHPENYEELGINFEAGFLLFGPPGCGKTLIAKAVANEAGANFIHIKGPELLNKYVGESESEVRKIFARARTNSPCILFFDEVDALTTSRGKEGGRVVDSLLNQLLIELDGADDRQGVFVIGATNRIEVMDPAVLRPGRLGKKLYVPLPGSDERAAIMKAHARKKPIDADVDLDALARMERCNNLTGADLASLMNEAAMFTLEERLDLANKTGSISDTCSIKKSHFELALSKITPSVTDKQREYYEILSNKYQATR